MSGSFGVDSTNEGPQATLGIGGNAVGSELTKVLLCDQIEPGSELGYQTAKIIYTDHPLGAKLVDKPIKLAMSQPREIVMPHCPEEAVKKFKEQWLLDECDTYILNVARLARIYGIATLAFGIPDYPTDKDIPLEKLADSKIYFNVLDPLNTSGSLVLNQDPNAPDFQKLLSVSIGGQAYARSRVVVLMNEQPVYIEYTNSAFGFVGRSVYQRALFALKSFLQTMLTDDMVSQKAGVLVAKIKPAGSIFDKIMSGFNAIKRTMIKGSRNNNVIAITPDEDIQSINLQGLEGPAKQARQNILQNIAMATDMPSKLIGDETFVEGFGEGTEDAKAVAHYIDGVRTELAPVYNFMTMIIQARAWTPAFFETMKKAYPDIYGELSWKQFFYTMRNDFEASWPSLLTEPDSEKVKVDESKLKAVREILQEMLPSLDAANKVRILQWAASNFNDNKMMFQTPLHFDESSLLSFLSKQEELATSQQQAPPVDGQSTNVDETEENQDLDNPQTEPAKLPMAA